MVSSSAASSGSSKGDVALHDTGSGGISGGGSFAATGVSIARAAWSNVLFASVTGSQPPPFQ